MSQESPKFKRKLGKKNMGDKQKGDKEVEEKLAECGVKKTKECLD